MPTTRTTDGFANLPLPAGAVRVYDDDGGYRVFDGTTRTIQRNGRYQEDVMVRLQGVQHSDGRVERQIAVSPLTQDQPLTIE